MKRKRVNRKNFGPANGDLMGIFMKEMVRRAIEVIIGQKYTHEAFAKEGYTGKMDDLVTSADKAAQAVYVRSLRQCFPGIGIIGEEGELIIPCTDGTGRYFTVDPLDGTKAFARLQFYGVGTMLSLSSKREGFIAAFIGDVNTKEIFGFRPGSNKVHRISQFNNSNVLKIKGEKKLKDQFILMRSTGKKYSALSNQLANNAFKDIEISGGSIGVWMARLWIGEVGAVLMHSSTETPWDANPINAISLKLGFAFFKPSEDGKTWVRFKPVPIQKTFKRDYDILVIHESNIGEFCAVMA